MSKDNLGDRIKEYEGCYRTYLPNRLPIICRLDGRSWHSLTKKCKKPFDLDLIDALDETVIHLCNKIQGVRLAYTQSDEIQLLIYNPDFETCAWFDNNLQKMVSISAALASSYFTSISHKVFGQMKLVQFDSRVFVVPLHEVVNVFEFRQQDCTRNSIQMLAQSLYSQKELNNKDCNKLKELCLQKGQDWNNLPTSLKRGRCCVKKNDTRIVTNKKTNQIVSVNRSQWEIDNNIPIFHKDRSYIEGLLK